MHMRRSIADVGNIVMREKKIAHKALVKEQMQNFNWFTQWHALLYLSACSVEVDNAVEIWRSLCAKCTMFVTHEAPFCWWRSASVTVGSLWHAIPKLNARWIVQALHVLKALIEFKISALNAIDIMPCVRQTVFKVNGVYKHRRLFLTLCVMA